jgi:hypothetical protein
MTFLKKTAKRQTMDSELRKNIRLRWFENLFELSHYEFQKKVWLEAGIENYVSDYNEVVCTYFDDLDLGSGLRKFVEEGFITESEAQIFFEFHSLFEKYVDEKVKGEFSDAQILQDKEWINLTNLANENWKKLKKVLIEKAELNYITELEKKY